MAFPTVEFVIAPATEAFRANPRDSALTGPIVEIMRSCQGMISTSFGLQHEDKRSAHIAVIWHSLADHKALMNDPAKYVKVGESLAAILDVHAIAMLHCAFIGELYNALEAPVTEIVTMTLNKGASKDTLGELVQELVKAANDSPPESGTVSTAWGPCVEKDDVFFFMVGWTSVEAHYASVKASQEAQEIISKLRAIATVEVIHVALHQEKPRSLISYQL